MKQQSDFGYCRLLNVPISERFLGNVKARTLEIRTGKSFDFGAFLIFNVWILAFHCTYVCILNYIYVRGQYKEFVGYLNKCEVTHY